MIEVDPIRKIAKRSVEGSKRHWQTRKNHDRTDGNGREHIEEESVDGRLRVWLPQAGPRTVAGNDYECDSKGNAPRNPLGQRVQNPTREEQQRTREKILIEAVIYLREGQHRGKSPYEHRHPEQSSDSGR